MWKVIRPGWSSIVGQGEFTPSDRVTPLKKGRIVWQRWDCESLRLSTATSILVAQGLVLSELFTGYLERASTNNILRILGPLYLLRVKKQPWEPVLQELTLARVLEAPTDVVPAEMMAALVRHVLTT